jgi:hypothetical protein
MEGCVEHRDVGNPGQGAPCERDRVDCGSVVQRCQLDELTEALFDSVVDPDRLAQLSAMDNAMSNRAYVLWCGPE